MRRSVRGLTGVAVVAAALFLGAAPARASCIQQTRAEQIARADVIAYGRVESIDQRAGTISFRPLTVYKGDPGPEKLNVQIGPGPRSGGVTSVDYRADPGEHVLYLQRQATGFETNDCGGSHAGPATADELRALTPPGTKIISYSDPGPDRFDPWVGPGLAALAVAFVGAALFMWRRRKPA